MRQGRSSESPRIVLLGIAAALSALIVASSLVHAQTPGRWLPPEQIYQTSGFIDAPKLVADNYGTVHLFWRESPESVGGVASGPELVYYARANGGFWSQPVDVVAMSLAASPAAAVDGDGIMNLIWRGPNATLYYASAPVAEATNVRAWSPVEAVADANLNAGITSGADGLVHMAFPGLDASGVFYTRYDPAQGGWLDPVNITTAAQRSASADFARIAEGPDGTLHVVWSEFRLPEAWPPTGVYYSRSTDGGNTWRQAEQLAGELMDQINVTAGEGGRVDVAWNGAVGTGGRYHRTSADNGETWSPPTAVVPAGKGGTEGPPQLVIDSAGTLHLLTTFDGCAWYAARRQGAWSEPECISGREATASRFMEQPALALVNGHELHAVFWDDRARLWHTTMETGAPPLLAVLPAPPAPATALPVATTPTATPEPTPTVTYNFVNDEPPATTSTADVLSRALMLAGVATAALIGMVVLVRMSRLR